MPLQFSPLVKVHTYDTRTTTLLKHLSPSTTLDGLSKQNGHVCTKKGRIIPNVLGIILGKFKNGTKRIKSLKRLNKALENDKLTFNGKPIKDQTELDKHVAWFVKHLRVLPKSQFDCTREKIMCKSVKDLRIWLEEGFDIFRKPSKLPRPFVNVRIKNLRIEGNVVKWVEQRPKKPLPKTTPLTDEKVQKSHFYINV
tara:strand:- start:49 stop:639 length:591 start_codon:yes stop_codon:yes gene_type:complete